MSLLWLVDCYYYRILSVPELSDLIEVHHDTLTNDTMSTLVGSTVTVIDGTNQVRQFIQNERTNRLNLFVIINPFITVSLI